MTQMPQSCGEIGGQQTDPRVSAKMMALAVFAQGSKTSVLLQTTWPWEGDEISLNQASSAL